MFGRQLVALFALIKLSAALQCNVQTTNQFIVQQCPANVFQCLKFTCTVGGGGQIITKGCNDPANPAASCAILTQNCAQQGGQGRCYTCSNYDLCNSSSQFSIFTALASLPILYYLNM